MKTGENGNGKAKDQKSSGAGAASTAAGSIQTKCSASNLEGV